MDRRFLTMIVGLLLAVCSFATSADTQAPEITPEPEIPSVIRDLSPLAFRAIDNVDLEPELAGVTLRNEKGETVSGIKTEWGVRCPDGFSPVDAETCEKITLEPKQSACPDGFNLTQSSDDIDVCQQVTTVEASASCPDGYTLKSDGATCTKTETKEATPVCDPGWTVIGDSCQQTITQSATIQCPAGYTNVGSGQCEKTISVEPFQECPPGSDEIDGMCSSVETAPSELGCRPGVTSTTPGYYTSGTCWYPVGLYDSGTPPTYNFECKSGYYRQSSSYSSVTPGCYREVRPNSCKWGSFVSARYGSYDGYQCVYPARYRPPSGGFVSMPSYDCRDANGVWKSTFGGNPGTAMHYDPATETRTCYNYNHHFNCPSGYTGSQGWCKANNPSQAGISREWYSCPNTRQELDNSVCWTISETAQYECVDGEKNPETIEEQCTTGWFGETCRDVWDHQSPEACITGTTVAKGTQCPAGYDFDGTDAVCGTETKTAAEESCPTGYTNAGGVCSKSEVVDAEVSCPPDFERVGSSCVATTAVPLEQCPAGFSLNGDDCVKLTQISAEKTYICPVDKLPQYCQKPNYMFDLYGANPNDVNLSAAEQEQACQSYVLNGSPASFTPINSDTMCANPYSQATNDGVEPHWNLLETDGLAQIETYTSCPTGYSRQYNNGEETCVKTDTIPACPDGYSVSGDQCVSSEHLPLDVQCPDGYRVSGESCVYSDTQPVEYSCPEGQTLDGSTCIETTVSDSWVEGQGCPDGSTVVGGECVTTDVATSSMSCPDGFDLESGDCKRTDETPVDLSCGDSSWNLQSTTCWRTITEPSFEQCPGGDWIIEGGECVQTIQDTPKRVCPEDFTQSTAYYDECVKKEEVGGIQGNLLTVTLPKVWPGSYTLDLTVRDETGNSNSELFDINYQPQALALRDGAAKLNVPAVMHAFKWKDGAATLVTEPIEIDGNVLMDIRPVYAGVAADAESGYSVAGIDIAPGEYKQVMSAYDFGLFEGTLELPMYPLSGEPSTSDIVVSIGGTGEAASVIQVDAWTFSGEVKPEKDAVMQIFDELTISGETTGQTPCAITGRDYVAQTASELEDPYCLIEWSSVPGPMDVSGEPPRMEGRFDHDGQKEAGFIAYLVDREGKRFEVGRASAPVEVQKAMGSFSFEFAKDISTVLHTIEEFNADLRQVEGPDCRLTMDEDRAIDYAQNGYLGRLCLLEWFNLPGTLAQAPESSRPLLKGRVYSAGQYDLGFRVFAYTSVGVPVLIAEQSVSFEAVDPPKPTVEFQDGKEIVDGLYESYINGGRVASAFVKSKNADLAVVHQANNSVIEERVFGASPWSSEFATYQRIESIATELWQRDTHTVTARYVDMPQVMASDTVETLAVPDEYIGPVMYADADYVLNDDVIPVSVRIGHIYQDEVPYDASTMGEWQVRIVRQKTYDTYEPVTDWKEHDGQGKSNHSIDLSEMGIKEGYVRLYAQARVKSPVPEYSRVEVSSRPVFLTVLYGGEIDADIDGRRISGPVPFRGVFRLDLSDRGLFRAIGDVIWEMSSDGGETWVERENNARNMQYFDITLDEPGQYMLKAKLKNRNSGVAKETAPIEVIAYHKPEVTVDWRNDVFVGDEVTLSANVSVNGTEVDASQVDIEWSNDGGETFEAGGLQHVFERTTDPTEPRRERWEVRVKMPIAPADDPVAWTIEDGSISYRGIRGPRLYIQGPRVTEVGKSYEFEIYKGLPYSRMEYDIKGYFTLPDGTEVPGDSVIYTPTEEDLEERYVNLSYHGWVDGWKEQGAVNTDDHNLRIWEYRFPEFIIYGRYSADVAPVEATLYARPDNLSGRLEDPVYEWDIPAGIEVLEDNNPIARKLIIPESGTYEISVSVTDRRNNQGGVTEVIEVGEPEPYELSMRLVGSNEYNRAPFEILARPDIDGGHPRDKVVEYNYTVNGEPMELMGRYGQAVLGAGEHTVKLEIVSEFGLTGTVEETLSVYENEPPVCELEIYEGTFRYTVRNVCDDPDGYVTNYQWWVNDEPLILTGYRISIPKKVNGETITIKSIGTDDSGLDSELQETQITMPEPEPEAPEGEQPAAG